MCHNDTIRVKKWHSGGNIRNLKYVFAIDGPDRLDGPDGRRRNGEYGTSQCKEALSRKYYAAFGFSNNSPFLPRLSVLSVRSVQSVNRVHITSYGIETYFLTAERVLRHASIRALPLANSRSKPSKSPDSINFFRWLHLSS